MKNNVNQEIQEKLHRIRQFMTIKEYDVIRIQTPCLFAWLTGGGRNYVDITSSWTGAVLYITHEDIVAAFANNEADRIVAEELEGRLACEIRQYPWWGWADDIVTDLLSGKRVAGDMAFPGVEPIAEELRGLFYPLLSEEINRYDQLGKDVSEGFFEAIPHFHQGMSENQLAGVLTGSLSSRGILPVVTMVAVDNRTEKYMHPLPTEQKLEKYAVISICAQRGGLVVSQTRSIHVGSVNGILQERHQAASYIAASLMAHSNEGEEYAQVYRHALSAYQVTGWGEEWKKHHFGGLTGYRTREWTLHSESRGIVTTGTALAWNPTILGAKSEDTILVEKNGARILGEDNRWPQLTFNIQGVQINRPDIFVI